MVHMLKLLEGPVCRIQGDLEVYSADALTSILAFYIRAGSVTIWTEQLPDVSDERVRHIGQIDTIRLGQITRELQ